MDHNLGNSEGKEFQDLKSQLIESSYLWLLYLLTFSIFPGFYLMTSAG